MDFFSKLQHILQTVEDGRLNALHIRKHDKEDLYSELVYLRLHHPKNEKVVVDKINCLLFSYFTRYGGDPSPGLSPSFGVETNGGLKLSSNSSSKSLSFASLLVSPLLVFKTASSWSVSG